MLSTGAVLLGIATYVLIGMALASAGWASPLWHAPRAPNATEWSALHPPETSELTLVNDRVGAYPAEAVRGPSGRCWVVNGLGTWVPGVRIGPL